MKKLTKTYKVYYALFNFSVCKIQVYNIEQVYCTNLENYHIQNPFKLISSNEVTILEVIYHQ